MKLILFIAIVFLSTKNVIAQNRIDYYVITVSFYSKCCGVPDSKPLFDSIVRFKKKNKIKTITYDRLGPLGKEGEYQLGFLLKELSKKQRANFITMVEKITPTLIGSGDSNSAGGANMKLNVKIMKAEDLGRAKIEKGKL